MFAEKEDSEKVRPSVSTNFNKERRKLPGDEGAA